MGKILITTSSFNIESSEALRDVSKAGHTLIANPYGRRLAEEEVLALIKEHQPVGMIAGVEPLTRTVLETADTLKVISRCGTGLDSVDLEAAKELGIEVFNTPGAPSQAVAELTITLILSALRHVPRADRTIRSGDWKPFMGNLLSGKSLGLIGGGRIGRRVADLAAAFGSKPHICDPMLDASQSSYPLTDLTTLLSNSDIISLHVPRTEQTENLLNAERIANLKPSAIVVNTSRGGLIDENALYDALHQGRIAGAALDVFSDEPYEGPLTHLDNIVLSNHMGSYAQETRALMEQEAAENLKKGLNVVPSKSNAA